MHFIIFVLPMPTFSLVSHSLSMQCSTVQCPLTDTAFMFITGGLFLVKVFQNRHPDIHTNAFLAFFTFAVLLIFTLFGLVSDRGVCVICALLMHCMCLLLSSTSIVKIQSQFD